jgi:hypothetical protein
MFFIRYVNYLNTVAFSVAGNKDMFISIHVAHAVARVHGKKNNGIQVGISLLDALCFSMSASFTF